MILRLLLLPAFGVSLVLAKPDVFVPRDFVEYWSAARVTLDGGNPYDAKQLLPVQRDATGDPELTKVVSLWTPPWTLPVYLPFGFEPFAVARLIWIALQFLLIAVSVELLWRTYGGKPSVIPHAVAAGFAPVFWNAFFGQNTGILLLGLCGFLYFRTREQPYLAGAFAALTALKPHMLAVFGIVLACDAVTRAGRKSLAAGLGVIALGAVVAVGINPAIFGQFVEAVRQPSTPEAISLDTWQVPLLAYRLRQLVDPPAFWMQFVPCLLACATAVAYRWTRRNSWDWPTELPRLVFVSALLAPYGAWMFDLTILLVPVIAATVAVSRTTEPLPKLVIGTLFTLLFALGLERHELQHFIWFTPATGGLWLAAGWLGRRQAPHSDYTLCEVRRT